MMEGPGGAVAAARRLLSNGDIQSGIERLIRMGRQDLTIEQAVLDPRWTSCSAGPIVRRLAGAFGRRRGGAG
jgi:hypothetical protein